MVMGKRNSMVILSSDDEDNDKSRSLSSNSKSSSFAKSKSRSTTTSCKGKKRARPSDSRSRSTKDAGKLHEISFLGEDFNEVFTGFKVSAGTPRSSTDELWVDKYKPHSLDELAVHKKKVEEVKSWFEERLKSPKGVYSSNILVVSGQAGVGKSATIRVIASHLGARLDEWNTPTPVIWQEHLYNTNTGVQYISKLDEFEMFIEGVQKYGMKLTSFGRESNIILLIDDIPLTNGRAALGRLKKCLHLLVQSTPIPTAILVTDYSNTDSADRNMHALEELRLYIESAGACKVAFNPITTNSIKKMLFRICQLEQFDVTAEHVDQIAKASGGDIRHAITSLQFFCLKQDQVPSLSLSSSCPSVSRKKRNDRFTLDDGNSLQFSRDETLSLFHALGKFLHNKREMGAAIENDQDACCIQESLARLPLKMDAPEKVLSQAHAQPGPVADFLHENVLDFLNEEAIDNAWNLFSYLGDADILLATLRRVLSRHNEAESILQSAAASVAVRGVLFGNSHPLSSRWHVIRRPKLWQAEKASLSNKNDMLRWRTGACNGLSLHDVSVMATEYMPMFKLLGDFDKMSLNDQTSGISDDDIEEC